MQQLNITHTVAEYARQHCFGADSRLYNATFEKDLFEDIDNPLRKAAIRYVLDWKHNKAGGHSLFMYGTTGIGKSFYGACITNELLRKDKDNLFKDLKVMYCFIPSLEWASANERNAILEKVKASDFVFVDEFDAAAIAKNAINFYFAFFNTLYERKIPFVLTTNASPESMFADQQNDVRFAKIYDRIAHQCAKYGFQTSKFCIRLELAKREAEEEQDRQTKMLYECGSAKRGNRIFRRFTTALMLFWNVSLMCVQMRIYAATPPL